MLFISTNVYEVVRGRLIALSLGLATPALLFVGIGVAQTFAGEVDPQFFDAKMPIMIGMGICTGLHMIVDGVLLLVLGSGWSERHMMWAQCVKGALGVVIMLPCIFWMIYGTSTQNGILFGGVASGILIGLGVIAAAGHIYIDVLKKRQVLLLTEVMEVF